MDKTESGQHSRRSRQSRFVPLALLATAVLIWFAAGAWQQLLEYHRLSQFIESQEASALRASRFLERLDRFTLRAIRLADDGNPAAQRLVAQLRDRGILAEPGQPELSVPRSYR